MKHADGCKDATACTIAAGAAVSLPVAKPDVWWQGSDYYELLHAKAESQTHVRGLEGLSAAEIHALATTFSHWDLDRDGVLGAEEFALVVNSLAQDATLNVDADTVQRLIALLDQDGSGNIDFNEFAAVARK